MGFGPRGSPETSDRLTRARAEGEVNLVAKLEADPDWRAGAFLLERGYRERWSKDREQTIPEVIIHIPDSLANVLADALRVGRAQIVAMSQAIETSADVIGREGERGHPK